MILPLLGIFGIKIIFVSRRMNNLWVFKVLKFFLLRSRPGSNRGPSVYEHETLRNDLILSYFTHMISSQKSKFSNLNTFEILQTITISKFSNCRAFSQYNLVWGRPPDFKDIKLWKSTPYAKSEHVFRLLPPILELKNAKNSIKIAKIMAYYSIWAPQIKI